MRRVWIPLLAVAGALAAAAPASADVVWLCDASKPGANPCRDSLETTVQEASGASRVDNPPLPANLPVDCFYVYPTVSEQPSQNANKDKDPEVVAIAQYQAARFSQVCDVYAPMYRQQTLVALGAGGSPAALQIAYGDVAEAWKAYLATRNRGRPIVLIGHSQGTRMLRALIRKEIDGSDALRGRLVSAVLLGGNVLVRRGQRAGGDFANVPACAARAETGCVTAFSTFNAPPPPNSRYGRSPAAADTGLGLPGGPEYEVLCTNPVTAGNTRAPLHTLVRGEPFPGFIGALMTETYGGPQPSAPTAFLRPGDRYSGRCETHDGANVLMIEPVGNARPLHPAPEPSWGLHLVDGNIAQGDLVERTGEQIAAYLGSKPAVQLPRLAITARRSRRCSVLLRVRGADRALVRRLEVRRGRRVLARDRRSPYVVRLKRGRRSVRVRAVIDLRDGRRAVVSRRLPACG